MTVLIDGEQLMTTREVADSLGIHVNNVGKAIKLGRLAATAITPLIDNPFMAKYAVRPSEVERYRSESLGKHNGGRKPSK